MRFRTVLFDLDGTLIDHFAAIHRCHAYAMTRLGLPAPSLAEVRAAVGGGLALAQHFVHENRIRQAASSLGAATYCVEEAVKYARQRKPFGKALAENQAIQFPLVELATQCEMLRLLIRKTAWEMDQMSKPEVEKKLSDKVSMCNYWANRLVCEAADRAMQVHGGIGYSRHKPFEHIYRHHRRYRITEGSEEIQIRRVAGALFVAQTLVGALLAHYYVERTGFYGIGDALGIDIVSLLPFSVGRTWHINLAILWITALWLAGGLFLPGLFTDGDPPLQAAATAGLLGVLVATTVGAFAGALGHHIADGDHVLLDGVHVGPALVANTDATNANRFGWFVLSQKGSPIGVGRQCQ